MHYVSWYLVHCCTAVNQVENTAGKWPLLVKSVVYSFKICWHLWWLMPSMLWCIRNCWFIIIINLLLLLTLALFYLWWNDFWKSLSVWQSYKHFRNCYLVFFFLTDSSGTLGRFVFMEQWRSWVGAHSICCWQWSHQYGLCYIHSVNLHVHLLAGSMYSHSLCVFSPAIAIWSLQCFDAVGWAAGRASGL